MKCKGISQVRPTTDWVCASSTLFGIEVAKAAQAVCKLIPGGKALSRQLLLACSTHEALLMPRLLPVGNASCGDSLIQEKKESVFLRVAGLYFDLVKRKGDGILLGGRRRRRLSNSKIIILLGVDLLKIMCFILISLFIKRSSMLKVLYSACTVKSHSIVLCFSSYSLYAAFRIHVLGFVSSLSLSSL